MSEAMRDPGPNGRSFHHNSLPEAVHDELRRRILNNEFSAGERLVELRIAEEFGVSRTTLREALRKLASENLVEITKRRGCFVARMDASEVRDSCFARFVLEAGAATDDLSWITPEVIARLEGIVEQMRASALEGDMASIVDTDTEFHSVIVSAGMGNRVRELWHMLDGQMGSLMRSSLDQQGIDMNEVVERHIVVIDALRSRRYETIHKAIKDHYLSRAPIDPMAP
jgi:DNA-binding GntR family transcriptional regulator